MSLWFEKHLPTEASRIVVKKILDAGYECYLVGGFVRDFLLKVDSNDIDVATNARYEELREIFKNYKTDVIGKDFQTLKVLGVDVATYRADVYNANYVLVKTLPVKTIVEDLRRRDITINSIAIEASTGKIVDPMNGIEDLKKKFIRLNDNEFVSIIRDPMRMMRACRFLAMLQNGRFKLSTFKAIAMYAEKITEMPPERIHKEIMKAMAAKNAGNFFRALNNTGILKHVFPSMMATVGHWGERHHDEQIFEHCCTACDLIETNDPVLKVAAFLHDVGKPMAWRLCSNGSFKGHDMVGAEIVERDLRKLRFSNMEIMRILSMIRVHMMNFTTFSTGKSIRRLVSKLDENNVPVDQFISMVIADHDANFSKNPHPPMVRTLLHEKVKRALGDNDAMTIKNLAIDGNDVMRITGLRPGKMVGEILTILLDRVISDSSVNNRSDLEVFCKVTYKTLTNAEYGIDS